MMKILLLLPIIFFLNMILGCVSFRISPKIEDEYPQVEENFLDNVNLTVVDDQFIYSGKMQPKDFYLLREMPSAGKPIQMSIILQKCEVINPFWKNPWSLLTTLVLTVGNTYECKTSVKIADSRNQEEKSYQSISRYYVITGLGAILAGPLIVPMLRLEKRERVRSAMYMYFIEKGMIPVSSHTLK